MITLASVVIVIVFVVVVLAWGHAIAIPSTLGHVDGLLSRSRDWKWRLQHSVRFITEVSLS